MSKTATTPSVGRILHYLPAKQDHTLNVDDHTQPLVAQILFVQSPTVVRLNVIDHQGDHHFRRNVPILEDASLHDGQTDACVWMPYQKAVAAGAEANQHA